MVAGGFPGSQDNLFGSQITVGATLHGPYGLAAFGPNDARASPWHIELELGVFQMVQGVLAGDGDFSGEVPELLVLMSSGCGETIGDEPDVELRPPQHDAAVGDMRVIVVRAINDKIFQTFGVDAEVGLAGFEGAEPAKIAIGFGEGLVIDEDGVVCCGAAQTIAYMGLDGIAIGPAVGEEGFALVPE